MLQSDPSHPLINCQIEICVDNTETIYFLHTSANHTHIVLPLRKATRDRSEPDLHHGTSVGKAQDGTKNITKPGVCGCVALYACALDMR